MTACCASLPEGDKDAQTYLRLSFEMESDAANLETWYCLAATRFQECKVWPLASLWLNAVCCCAYDLLYRERRDVDPNPYALFSTNPIVYVAEYAHIDRKQEELSVCVTSAEIL